MLGERVFDELAKTPEQAKTIENMPWLSIQYVSDQALFDQLKTQLDVGESEAIALAVELKAGLLLIDERGLWDSRYSAKPSESGNGERK